MARVGVLLLNLGGPERIKDVGPFLYNLFSDPEIIRLPVRAFQKPLAWIISLLRGKISRLRLCRHTFLKHSCANIGFRLVYVHRARGTSIIWGI